MNKFSTYKKYDILYKYLFPKLHTMSEVILPDWVLEKILKKMNQTTTPKEFLRIFEDVKSNPVLARILSLWEDEREKMIQKLTYASTIFNDAMYIEIGEKAIKAPGMTLDKICTIAIWEPETAGLMGWGLTLKQVEAITWEWLAHKDMTVGKITQIWFGATPQQIKEIWPENIARMPTEKLVPLLMF